MLLFNYYSPNIFSNSSTFKYILCYCSIRIFQKHRPERTLFKYILCYCSIDSIENNIPEDNGLNTSYVIVQSSRNLKKPVIKIKFKYILCYCSINMCKCKICNNKVFKYILCYCSIEPYLKKKVEKMEFKYILCYCSILVK